MVSASVTDSASDTGILICGISGISQEVNNGMQIMGRKAKSLCIGAVDKVKKHS